MPDSCLADRNTQQRVDVDTGMTEVRDNPERSRYELHEDGNLLGVAD